MGLYDDLKDGKQQGWANVNKMQPPKKPSGLAPPPSVLMRAGRGGGRAPLIPGRGGGGRGPPPSAMAVAAAPSAARDAAMTAASPSPAAATATAVAPPSNNAFSIFAGQGPVKDEYDPAKPNDYEQVVRERERKRREAEAEAERQAKIREVEAQVERLKQQDGGIDQRDWEPSQSAAATPSAEAEAARRAALLNVSGEEAFARRARLGRPGAGAAGAAPGAAAELPGPPGAGPMDDDAGPKGMSLAQKLLEKMGWKSGEGLGRNRQGISTPLVMQKTDRRAGVIVAAEPVASSSSSSSSMPPPPLPGPPEKKPKGVAIQGRPSKVLCLRNMVGPGEVDEKLEDEVGEECSKYGAVTSVLIYEVTTLGYPETEAVRIFVQFDRVESATKALVDLHGRFFGGRTVQATFFSEDRFDAMELAPQAGEFN